MNYLAYVHIMTFSLELKYWSWNANNLNMNKEVCERLWLSGCE